MTKKILAALLAASVLTMVPVAAGTSTLPGGGKFSFDCQRGRYSVRKSSAVARNSKCGMANRYF